MVAAAALVGCRAGPSPQPPAPRLPFAAARAAAPTVLHTHGPSPGKFEAWPPPDGAQRRAYASDGRELWGWFARPPEPVGDAKLPAVVYFHGAFSLTPDDFAQTRPLREAGFCVFTPTLRGENGNPGDLQLLWGELDDAVAAIAWTAAQPEVDPARVYAVGHSIGGAVAALTSLRPDAPVRITGSIGGIYVPETFVRWRDSASNRHLVRFDPTVTTETHLRTLGPNVADMVHPHVAYVGEADRWFHANAEAVAAAAAEVDAPFRTERVPGDHMSSLGPGLAKFVEVIAADAEAAR